MKDYADWTGHVTARAEEGERLTHALDWTGHPTVSIDTSRKWNKDTWIGPGILAFVLLYLGGVWWLTEWIGGWLGEDLAWVSPLILFFLVIPFPAVTSLYVIVCATVEPMTPFACMRYLKSKGWGDSSSDDSGFSSSSSYDGGGSSGGGSFGGGGCFGGGGGGGTW